MELRPKINIGRNKGMELGKDIYKVSGERKEGTQPLSLGVSSIETLVRGRQTTDRGRTRTEGLEVKEQ